MLLCSPYKFFGPHLGLAFGRARAARALAAVQGAARADEPLGHRFETGTLPHELLAGFVAAVEYVDSIGWDAIQAHERALGERFLDGLPDGCRLLRAADDGRPRRRRSRSPSTGCRRGGRAAARRARAIAVWHGNYYALEVMKRLGLRDDGAVRVGFVHYNTADEVDRLLAALAAL